MRKFFKAALSILMIVGVFISAVPPVYASDTTQNSTSTAYAVFDPNTKELDFIRSTEAYTNGSTGTATSISGGSYAGTIYTNFEKSGNVPWAEIAAQIQTVKFIDPIVPVSTFLWFKDMSNCTSMDLATLDTENVTTMRQMFSGCSSIRSIDLSHFDTSKVTDMYGMFRDCTSLISLDVSHFDTSNVINMSQMFYNCQKAPIIDVSRFNTSKATDMSWMFYGCWALQTLNVSNFDTTQVTNTKSMFYGCHTITTLDVRSFDTSKMTDMSYMFADCFSLKDLQLDEIKFNTSMVTDMSYMFSNCKVLQSIDVSHFDTSKVTDMSYMFTMCNALQSLDVSNFDTSMTTNMRAMFSNCKVLRSIDVSHFDTSKVTDMNSMFAMCNAIKELDVSHFDTSNVTNMYAMFSNCKALQSIDVSHFDTSKVTNMRYMFTLCNMVKELDVSHFDTSRVTNMNSMFSNCNTLQSIDVSSFDTSKVTDMRYMFSNATNIKKMIFGDKFKLGSLYTSIFPSPKSTVSGKKSSGLWGIGSETAKTTYSPNDLAVYGASKVGALSGTWYAQIPAYTISFDANQGSGSMDHQTVSGPSSLNANSFTRKGYKFIGWNTSPNGSGKSYKDGETITPTGNMNLYAQWKYVPVIVKIPKSITYKDMEVGEVNVDESYDVSVDCGNSYTVVVKGNAKNPTSGSEELSASVDSQSSSLTFTKDGTKQDGLHIKGNAKYGKYTGYIQYVVNAVWKS